MSFKPIKYLKSQLIDALNAHKTHQDSVPNLLLKDAIKDSADFAKENMQNAMMFFDHKGIWDYSVNVISKQNREGLFLEFGVFQGASINYISSKLPNKIFHGFDSFEGLKEDWSGWSLTKGAFNLDGKLPPVNSNVELIKGWFDQTLPGFMNNQSNQYIQWLHIDCDTYEATKTVFECLESNIQSGTLILFDEFFGYRGWEIGEYKAFQEFINKTKLQFKYKAFAKCQVLVEIL